MNQKEIEKLFDNFELGLAEDGRLVLKFYDDNDNWIGGVFLTDDVKETQGFLLVLSKGASKMVVNEEDDEE